MEKAQLLIKLLCTSPPPPFIVKQLCFISEAYLSLSLATLSELAERVLGGVVLLAN